MRLFHTLRFKLTIFYVLFIVTPFVISAFALPYYIQGMLTRETRQLTAGTVAAMSRNIETYLDDLDRLSTSPYLSDEVMYALKLKANDRYRTANEYTKLKTDRALSGTLPQYLINTRPDILNTIIIPRTGPAYLTAKGGQFELVREFPFQEQEWYRQAVEADGRGVIVSSHPQNYFTASPARQVFSVARLIKDPDSRQPLAVILADADTQILRRIAKDTRFNVSSTIVILDQNESVLYSSSKLPQELTSMLPKFHQENEWQTDAYTAVSDKVGRFGWRIAVFLSNQEFDSKVRWIYVLALTLSAGALTVTFGVFLYFSRWIVKPFKKMNLIMSKAKMGDMSERFVARGQDEIAQLGISLNSMVSRLDELINQEYRAKLATQNAEYRALQSQIRPHFLFNTLNGFIGLNRQGRTKELENAILSLSSMMRYTLEDNQTTTIEKEFQFLQKYCLLQQTRFDESFTAHVEWEEELAGVPIPKLLIQPLVENAVIHGIEPDEKQNVLLVTAHAVQENGKKYVEITVQDDGLGFDSIQASSQGHVGLSNVRSRLLMNDPDATFTVTSRPGHGTKAVIRIPIGAAAS
ncbi:sensor histidine kinase [Cohnella pontilimi]|uniref:Sensor histidine kinase n=1 Tax=Cohnella pontilimi TaxID=2564100 RepID=A0A4U0F7V3_9BACL|nr:sensor histidine kinase [Cohnella pontilimi]TJY40671.1 sensor histidine kinase [Cohnella pontilimi]